MNPNDRYVVREAEADQIVSEFLAKINSDNVNDTLKWGCTALQFACSKGNVEAVDKLLEVRGINVNCMDVERWTPLHDACNENSFQVVEKLLAVPGIDVNIMTVDGKTPLHQALLSSDYEMSDNSQVIAKLLAVSEIDVNIRDVNGMTPLHYVSSGMATCYNPEAIFELLDVPKIDVNVRSYNSMTAIMEAAKHGQTDALRVLMEDSRVDLDLKDKDGKSLEELVIGGHNNVDYDHLETIIMIKEEKQRREKDMKQELRMNEDSSGDEDISDELKSVRINIRKQYAERLDRVCENIENEKFRLRKLAELKQNEIKVLKEKKDSEQNNLQMKLEANKVELEAKKVDLKETIAKLEKQILDLDQSLIDLEQNKLSETEAINNKYVKEVSKLEQKFTEDEKEDKLESLKEIKTQLTRDLGSFEGYLNDNGPSKYRKNVEAARHTLECPVCLEIMSPPARIWMCSVGHLVCEPCKTKLEERKCPTCRTGKVKQRSVLAEKFARAVFDETSCSDLDF